LPRAEKRKQMRDVMTTEKMPPLHAASGLFKAMTDENEAKKRKAEEK